MKAKLTDGPRHGFAWFCWARARANALPLRLVIPGCKSVICEDVAGASAAFCALRDECQAGSRTWPTGILYLGRRRIASISYNGKVWNLDGRLRFDPYAVRP